MLRLFRFTRSFILLAIVVVLAGAAACFVGAGRMIVDPQARATPEPADVIFVLSGAGTDRWVEGHELWVEKRAPLMLLSRGYADAAGIDLRRRGVHLPDGAEIARDVMTRQLGVPPASIELLNESVDNTAEEAQALARMATARGWRRVIVVTSLPHTRRTSLAMSRALDGSGVAVQVRATRYDAFQPAAWWRTRGSIRWVSSELPKLVAYWLGLGE
jgi:uncharacterized SAM-binding protein YcdF (DUF218 family)